MRKCKDCGQSSDRVKFPKDSGKPRPFCSDCFNLRRRTGAGFSGPKPEPVAPVEEVSDSGIRTKLLGLLKKGVKHFEELCDSLGLPPSRVRSLLSELKSSGVIMHSDKFVALKPLDVVGAEKITEVIPRTVKKLKVGVISDLHYGSKYCLRERINDFVEYAYGEGVRTILIPGDLLDGHYVDHGLFELSHVGLEPQVDDMIQNLPKKKGLQYHCITGNHDQTFITQNGANVGRAITDAAAIERGGDIKWHGHRGAKLSIGGTIVELWHPQKGSAYAVSYPIQKKIESFVPGEKPHILLIGHWHRFCYVVERGVHGIACPTFQGGGSAFGRSLTSGAPAIGGIVLSWDSTEHGTVRNFKIDLRSYYEIEKPREIESP